MSNKALLKVCRSHPVHTGLGKVPVLERLQSAGMSKLVVVACDNSPQNVTLSGGGTPVQMIT